MVIAIRDFYSLERVVGTGFSVEETFFWRSECWNGASIVLRGGDMAHAKGLKKAWAWPVQRRVEGQEHSEHGGGWKEWDQTGGPCREWKEFGLYYKCIWKLLTYFWIKLRCISHFKITTVTAMGCRGQEKKQKDKLENMKWMIQHHWKSRIQVMGVTRILTGRGGTWTWIWFKCFQ